MLKARFQQSWPQGVTRKRVGFKGSIKEWIKQDCWSIDSKVSKKKAILAPYSESDYIDACVNDALILASAAFETAYSKDAQRTEQKSAAWQFVKIYYAAYYGANALMRLSGRCCSNLAAEECAAINEYALLVSQGGDTPERKISPGLYEIQLEKIPSTKIFLRTISGKGGVHIQFWICFLNFLNQLKLEIKNQTCTSIEKIAATEQINNLIAILTREDHKNGAWLSEIRNSINYRFEHGLWHPYAPNSPTKDAIYKQFKDILKESNPILSTAGIVESPLIAAKACGFILNWLHYSIEQIENSCGTERKKIISTGALNFLRSLS